MANQLSQDAQSDAVQAYLDNLPSAGMSSADAPMSVSGGLPPAAATSSQAPAAAGPVAGGDLGPIGPPSPPDAIQAGNTARFTAPNSPNNPINQVAASTPSPSAAPAQPLSVNSLPQYQQQYLRDTEALHKGKEENTQTAIGGVQHLQDTLGAIQAETDRAQQEHAAKVAADLQAQQLFQQKAEASQRAADEAIRQKAAAIKEVDPDRRSTPAKILGAIAMGLGAFGSGITKTPNFAMDIINNQIKNDVNAQKDNIEKQWKQINLDNGLNNNQTLRDAHSLEQMRQASQVERLGYIDLLQNLAAKAGNATAQQNAGLMIKSLQDDMSKDRQLQYSDRLSMLTTADKQRQAQAAAGATHSREMQKQYAEMAAKLVSKEGGSHSAEEADAIAKHLVFGTDLPAGGTNQSTNPDLAVTDTNGQVRNAISPEAQKATEPLMRAVRIAKSDLDAYQKDPSEQNYSRAVMSAGQVDGLRRAPGTPVGIGQSLKQWFGVSTGNIVADSIPNPAKMATDKNALDGARTALQLHGKAIEESAFGPFKPQGQKIQ